MNLNNLKEKLLKMGEKIGLQVHEEDANSVTLHSQITAKEYFINSADSLHSLVAQFTYS